MEPVICREAYLVYGISVLMPRLLVGYERRINVFNSMSISSQLNSFHIALLKARHEPSKYKPSKARPPTDADMIAHAAA
ncbi:hypothetical protein ACFLTV_00460 [Chloroflexota bacterium]